MPGTGLRLLTLRACSVSLAEWGDASGDSQPLLGGPRCWLHSMYPSPGASDAAQATKEKQEKKKRERSRCCVSVH